MENLDVNLCRLFEVKPGERFKLNAEDMLLICKIKNNTLFCFAYDCWQESGIEVNSLKNIRITKLDVSKYKLKHKVLSSSLGNYLTMTNKGYILCDDQERWDYNFEFTQADIDELEDEGIRIENFEIIPLKEA